METEGSLPHSQKPTNSPNPKLDDDDDDDDDGLPVESSGQCSFCYMAEEWKQKKTKQSAVSAWSNDFPLRRLMHT